MRTAIGEITATRRVTTGQILDDRVLEQIRIHRAEESRLPLMITEGQNDDVMTNMVMTGVMILGDETMDIKGIMGREETIIIITENITMNP